MSPNIFLDADRGPEDRFTFHWHYLLDNHPELGQHVVEFIAKQSGIRTSRFLGAEDHPFFTAADRPDFLLKCEDYRILCEHKLDSGLGESQLERYCALASDDKTYVVLITKSGMLVPTEVLSKQPYLRPDRPIHHFLWEDFYDIVKSTSGRLASEFVAYMDSLDMAPWLWGPWGDPFSEDLARAQFRQLWKPVLHYFKAPGRTVKKDPVGLGMQVQKPMPGVHLFWIGPAKSPQPRDERLTGYVMRLQVFRSKAIPEETSLAQVHGRIPYSEGVAYVRTMTSASRPSDDLMLLREYLTPLAPIMADDPKIAQDRLMEFVKTVVAHLEGKIDLLVDEPK